MVRQIILKVAPQVLLQVIAEPESVLRLALQRRASRGALPIIWSCLERYWHTRAYGKAHGISKGTYAVDTEVCGLPIVPRGFGIGGIAEFTQMPLIKKVFGITAGAWPLGGIEVELAIGLHDGER